MAEPNTYDLTRYLTAKRTIDARARNRRVWRRFIDVVNEKDKAAPLRVLEVGGGVGATAEQILAATAVPDIAYTLVDLSEANVARALENLRRWASDHEYACEAEDQTLRMHGRDRRYTVRVEAADVFDFLAATDATWDVFVAQAFWDLVNLDEAFARLRPALAPDAVLYFPLHFDGLTAFVPATDPDLDARILQAYHRTMDERVTDYGGSGGSRTGRKLLLALRDLGASLLAAGGSDWVVAAGPEGFTDDEAYFLHHILHFVETSVAARESVAPDDLSRWVRQRRLQIEDDTLIYVAHQLDVLGRWTPSSELEREM